MPCESGRNAEPAVPGLVEAFASPSPPRCFHSPCHHCTRPLEAMAANRAVSKKRKPELDLDAEKTMFGAFQQVSERRLAAAPPGGPVPCSSPTQPRRPLPQAASAVSAMYTLASQQQRKSKEAGAKQALVSRARGLRPPRARRRPARVAARPVPT